MGNENLTLKFPTCACSSVILETQDFEWQLYTHHAPLLIPISKLSIFPFMWVVNQITELVQHVTLVAAKL